MTKKQILQDKYIRLGFVCINPEPELYKESPIFVKGGIKYKECSRCENILEVDRFAPNIKYKYGVSQCRKCDVERQFKYKDSHNTNRRIRFGSSPALRQKRANEIRAWRKNNKKHKRQYDRKYSKQKRLLDPAYKLKGILRIGFRDFLKKNIKSTSVLNLLGCSPANFKQFIENQFTNEMSWDNYGKFWHLDHIVPISAFDCLNPSDLEICWNYHNFQPLDAYTNCHVKRDNILIAGEYLEKKIKLFGFDGIYEKLLNKLKASSNS